MGSSPEGSDEVQDVDAFAELAGLGVPEPDPVADLEGVSGRTAQGRLHLAGGLRRQQAQPGRVHGPGYAVLSGRAGGWPAAAGHGHETGAGTANDLHGEDRRMGAA